MSKPTKINHLNWENVAIGRRDSDNKHVMLRKATDIGDTPYCYYVTIGASVINTKYMSRIGGYVFFTKQFIED